MKHRLVKEKKLLYIAGRNYTSAQGAAKGFARAIYWEVVDRAQQRGMVAYMKRHQMRYEKRYDLRGGSYESPVYMGWSEAASDQKRRQALVSRATRRAKKIFQQYFGA